MSHLVNHLFRTFGYKQSGVVMGTDFSLITAR